MGRKGRMERDSRFAIHLQSGGDWGTPSHDSCGCISRAFGRRPRAVRPSVLKTRLRCSGGSRGKRWKIAISSEPVIFCRVLVGWGDMWEMGDGNWINIPERTQIKSSPFTDVHGLHHGSRLLKYARHKIGKTTRRRWPSSSPAHKQ